MGRRMMPLCAVLLVTLVSSVGYAAATSDAASSLSGVTVGGGSVTAVDKYSDAYAFTASDLDPVGTDEAEDSGTFWSRSATATVVGATATGQTLLYGVGAEAHAVPSSGSAGAYASALQAVYFQAQSTGTLTFDATYLLDYDLMTTRTGDTAGASGVVGLKLYDAAGNLLDAIKSASFDDYLEDGSSFASPGESGHLVVSGSFNAGDYGVLVMWADAEALAYTIPVPGALLLAGIGTGLVGWVRRRKLL